VHVRVAELHPTQGTGVDPWAVDAALPVGASEADVRAATVEAGDFAPVGADPLLRSEADGSGELPRGVLSYAERELRVEVLPVNDAPRVEITGASRAPGLDAADWAGDGIARVIRSVPTVHVDEDGEVAVEGIWVEDVDADDGASAGLMAVTVEAGAGLVWFAAAPAELVVATRSPSQRASARGTLAVVNAALASLR